VLRRASSPELIELFRRYDGTARKRRARPL
jgi:hypothetical protein